jgi:hypothetical protein
VAAVDVVLPGEAVQRLADAVEFTVGFPTDFIAAGERNPGVVGGNSTELDGR